MLDNILDKVSFHAVYDASIIDAVSFAHENGFAGVQIAVESPHLSFEKLNPAERARIARLSADTGVSISLHAPDETTSLLTCSPSLVEGILAYFSALFDFAQDIGARLITVHAGSTVSFATDSNPVELFPAADVESYKTSLGENLARLLDLAADRFVLCIENYRLEPWTLDTLMPYLDSGRLHLCWDLAKTYDSAGRLDEDLCEFFLSRLDLVKQVHLHDLADGRSHRAVSTGCVDFERLLPPLAAADVLDYCIEVRPREKALESLRHLKLILERIPVAHGTP